MAFVLPKRAGVSLKQVKSVLVRFCPFEANVESTRVGRDHMGHLVQPPVTQEKHKAPLTDGHPASGSGSQQLVSWLGLLGVEVQNTWKPKGREPLV
uniref:Uncharacterized protein n=1 Tax=Anolis carolinensis TaxID=28377 RepID=A0A803TTH1_ANOCA